MKSGIIADVGGDFGRLSDHHSEVEDRGYTLREAIEIIDSEPILGGNTAYYGKAAKDTLQSVNSPNITSEGIDVENNLEVETRVTEFVAVPGHLVVVSSGKGSFAFDLIGRIGGVHIDRVRLNLDAFLSDQENANIWQLGFYGTGGRAEKGVVYGNSVIEDTEFGNVLGVSNKNQVGLDFPYGEDSMKISMSESGYIDVYRPGDYTFDDFAEFLLERILPYVKDSEF